MSCCLLLQQSAVSVVFSITDYKNLHSNRHSFSSRFNGKTITNCSGIAFRRYNNNNSTNIDDNADVFVICDGNIFHPYIHGHNIDGDNHSNHNNNFGHFNNGNHELNENQSDIQIFVHFQKHMANTTKYAAKYVACHEMYGQSSARYSPFRFQHRHSHTHGNTDGSQESNHNGSENGGGNKFAYIVLLKVLIHENNVLKHNSKACIVSLSDLILSIHHNNNHQHRNIASQASPSPSPSLSPSPYSYPYAIGDSVYCVSNPFGVLCEQVLNHTLSHGILSTYLHLHDNNHINNSGNQNQKSKLFWISDIHYIPGMEGGLVFKDSRAGITGTVHGNGNRDGMHAHGWIGMVSIPLLIQNTLLCTIIPSDVIAGYLQSHFGVAAAVHGPGLGIGTTQAQKNENESPALHSNNTTVTTARTSTSTSTPTPTPAPTLNATPIPIPKKTRRRRRSRSPSLMTPATNMLSNMKESVLPIMIGTHWATCVLISLNNGDVFTNAHVIRPYLLDPSELNRAKRTTLKHENHDTVWPKIGVKTSLYSQSRRTSTSTHSGRKWLKCEIMYVAHSDSVWDIAWLRVLPSELKFLSSSSALGLHKAIGIRLNSENAVHFGDTQEQQQQQQPQKYNGLLIHNKNANKTAVTMTMPMRTTTAGDDCRWNALYQHLYRNHSRVYAIGYALIHPRYMDEPLISCGILSNVIYDDDDDEEVTENGTQSESAILLRSSASIHNGHSGGLLCDENENVLGLITNNAMMDFYFSKERVLNTWEKEQLSDAQHEHPLRAPEREQKDVSITYPTLNSIIPFNVLFPLYQCIIHGNGNGSGNRSGTTTALDQLLLDLDRNQSAPIHAKWNLISAEKIRSEVEFQSTMTRITDSIPQHLLQQKASAKL